MTREDRFPHGILNPGQLTHAEYVVMQQHTVIGEDCAVTLRSLAPVRPHSPSHGGLMAEAIPIGCAVTRFPLSAQIVGIAKRRRD